MDCNETKLPRPETWDSVEAQRYAHNDQDIYVPISHFDINIKRVSSVALHAFYTLNTTFISEIDIVSSLPKGITVPEKLLTGRLAFNCRVPNSIAFGIDDGIPRLAQQTVDMIKQEKIPVTFFARGDALLDQSTNLTNVYKEMLSLGHQVALHSYSHPAMEDLDSLQEIEAQYQRNIQAMKKTLGVLSTYFRPPFGTIGARMRQVLARLVPDPTLVHWSIDVEDWRWGTSDAPEKQLEAFRQSMAAGGDLVVMHYLYPSTLKYFPQMIKEAKAAGKHFLRVDQCMRDPEAPETWGYTRT